MADATSGRQYYRRPGDLYAFKVGAAEHLYPGTIGCKNADGYAVSGANTTGCKALGIIKDERDNSNGLDGVGEAASIWVEGVFRLNCSSAAVTDIGMDVYVVDNQSVQTSAAGSGYVKLGKITGVPATDMVDVKLDYNAS